MSPPPAPGSRLIEVRELSYRRVAPPSYPPPARRRGWQGTVLLRVTVNMHGGVETAALEESSGYQVLDDAALRAVRGWEFDPVLVDGVPQRATGLVPVRFALE